MKEYIIGLKSREKIKERLENNPELRDKFYDVVLKHLVHTSYINEKHSKEINLSGIYTQDDLANGVDDDYYFLFYLVWITQMEDGDYDG